MVFSSTLFLFVFLPASLLLYYLVPFRLRNLVLLLFSLIFYGWGEPLYVFVMIASIAMDYLFGYLIGKNDASEPKRRLYLILSIALNLAVFFFFKYLDFVIENLRLLPGLDGLETLGVSLPIGISFYTFQKMSYVIDVYRRDVRAQKNPVSFGAYVTMFPQLIAGPIIKYKDVDEQLTRRSCDAEGFASGVSVFMVGLCKKLLLANTVGQLFDAYKAMGVGMLTTAGAWLAVLAYSFQIYFDFSGYSDMAVGLGRMLGFEFMRNFEYPYIARSVTEFWRRWHISLSTWFREYLYIPLGGNRVKRSRWLLNILIVWLVTGLWHGAAWNFVLWGLYYALLLIAEKLFLQKLLAKLPRFFGHLYALLCIMVGWALFASDSLGACLSLLSCMFTAKNGLYAAADGYFLRSYLPMLVVMALASLPLATRFYQSLSPRTRRVCGTLLVLMALVVCTAVIVDSSYNPFLYFRF